jgi:hypothetical protein
MHISLPESDIVDFSILPPATKSLSAGLQKMEAWICVDAQSLRNDVRLKSNQSQDFIEASPSARASLATLEVAA